MVQIILDLMRKNNLFSQQESSIIFITEENVDDYVESIMEIN
jgi:hypothetical protein